MSGAWLVSYVALWLIVMGACAGLLGAIRELGLLRARLGVTSDAELREVPSIEHDGPAVGSRVVEMTLTLSNGFPDLVLPDPGSRSGTLLVFMSPMCESCQHVVDPLNALVHDESIPVRPVVIMRAGKEACRAFISVFPLHLPMICDCDRTVTRAFGTHRNPFALLYDESGVLVRKGIALDADHLAAVLSSDTATDEVAADVFPVPRGRVNVPSA